MGMREGRDGLSVGRHRDREIVILCVHWYLRCKLSLRDPVETIAERGLSFVHTNIMRWLKPFTPEFVKRWKRFAIPAGRSWRVEETNAIVRCRWVYPYWAVGQDGHTVRAKRNVASVKAFCCKANRHKGQSPKAVKLDCFADSPREVRKMKADGLLPEDSKVRSSRYLDHAIEQNHRNNTSRTNTMLGFRQFKNAMREILGILLPHHIREGRSDTTKLSLKDVARIDLWDAIVFNR